VIAQLTSEMLLPRGAELLMLGSTEQRRAFAEAFDGHHGRRAPGPDESHRSRQTH
jgi:hypothetical protein